MNNRKSAHYDDRYYSYQEPMGNFGGWADRTKFQDYIESQHDVLDFGCGGGQVLKNLVCRSRIGVEVNEPAAAVAASNGVQVYRSAEEVPDHCCDVMISNCALEHALDPLREIQKLRPKLRMDGKLVFVVPCENISYAYRPRDINHHLYSWSPMCLGNLLTEAGFDVLESLPYIHKWPPGYEKIAKLGGRTLFDLAARIYGQLDRKWFQVRAVAKRRL